MHTSLMLKWQTDYMHAPNSNEIYHIYENNIQKYSQPTTSPFLYITGLTSGTEYSYLVKHVNISTGDVISQSNILVVTTESYDNSYNLRATDITQTSMMLEWRQGNQYPSAPSQNRIYYIYENDIQKYSQSTSTPFLNITGLTPDTGYTYLVKNVDTSMGDVISQSNILVVTTENVYSQ